MKNKKIIMMRCTSYEINTLIDNISKMLDLYGLDGVSGKNVLLKPNILGPHKPETAVTTHPEFIRAVIRVLRSRGVNLVLGDSPSTVDKYEKVLKETEILSVCKQEKVEIINFNESDVIEVKLEDGGILCLTNIINKIDYIFSLPKFKTHSLMTFTGAVKNLYGLVPGVLKTEYHRLYPDPVSFSFLLVNILKQVKSKLKFNIFDGIVGMDGNGPAYGRIRNLGFIMCGEDAVLLDSFLCQLINIKLHVLLRMCSEIKLGEVRDFEVIGDKLKIEDFRLPPVHYVNYIPKILAKKISNLMWFRPTIDTTKCKLCFKCMKACPVGSIIEKEGKLFIKSEKCIKCMCCNEVCSYNAIKIERSFLVKVCQTMNIF